MKTFCLPLKCICICRSHINRIELRRASINMLISILALPLHFHVSRYCLRFSGEKEIFDRSPCSQQLPIEEIVSSGGKRTPVSFAHYRQRLTQLLLAALQVESDSVNTHLLLGAVYKLFGYLKPLLIYLCIFLVGGLANLIHDLASYDQMDSGGGLRSMDTTVWLRRCQQIQHPT